MGEFDGHDSDSAGFEAEALDHGAATTLVDVHVVEFAIEVDGKRHDAAERFEMICPVTVFRFTVITDLTHEPAYFTPLSGGSCDYFASTNPQRQLALF